MLFKLALTYKSSRVSKKVKLLYFTASGNDETISRDVTNNIIWIGSDAQPNLQQFERESFPNLVRRSVYRAGNLYESDDNWSEGEDVC